MRRSIFRGKCIDGEKAGTWVDGYQSAADYIASGSGDFLTEYLVDRKTVTECVGYHMGYEGDIFTYEGERYEIIWSEPLCGWAARNIPAAADVQPLSKFYGKEYKIIGNRFDHPELLKISKER